MKKIILTIALLIGMTGICSANFNVNNVSLSPINNQRIAQVNANLINTDMNREYQNITVIIQFLNQCGEFQNQTITHIQYMKPNTNTNLSFNCYVPPSATQYKILYSVGNVITPNYVQYQQQNNFVNNILAGIILNSIFR